ncbi:MAG: T9SS type A sorting domain-containing protein [Bacteroidetes bacterium]|nr:T9SS type A sorting domain-containing protein [Bacteroidota bacterium]
MRKLLFVLLLSIIASVPALAQSYIMSNTTVTTCSGIFYDTGGGSGDYGSNESLTMTITSANGNRVNVNFSSMIFASGDGMVIYDGPTTSHPRIGIFYGTSSPNILSTGSSLTFHCFTTSSNNAPGWVASITCAGPVLPVYNMSNGTVTACSGAFYDNGGAAGDYGNNLTITQTFCSGTSDHLQFSFLNFDSYYHLNTNDTLFMYDGATTGAPLLAIYVKESKFETITSSGTCITFLFKSDAGGQQTGWAGQFQCVSSPPSSPTQYSMSTGVRYVCNALFFDDGGPFEPYRTALNITQTFTSATGERLSLNFTFMSMSAGDYLSIYDGPTTAYPLIGTYENLPPAIISSGTSLTFVCHTYNMNAQGWAATINCAGPTLPVYNMSNSTITACSGVFYDNGGAGANYTNNQDISQTFCSGTSDHIQFSFNKLATGLSLGDTMFVHDGSSIADPLLAILVNGSNFETYTSSGTCLTFRFKSNASGNNRGWAGQFTCVSSVPPQMVFMMSTGIRYVCNALFYDDGGIDDYSGNSNLTQTFISNNGNRISVNFNSINLLNSDSISIYDGPSAAYPLLGTYSNSGSINFTSSGTSLTFVFVSTQSSGYSGWYATISCAGPALPVYNMSGGTVTDCSGAFYDNGGATANYTNNQDITQTFCSGTSDHIKFRFNNLATSLSLGDTLFIHDGNSTAAPLLAILVNGSFFETFTSSDTCLTFRFKSDLAGNNTGWAGHFSCVSSVPLPALFNMSAGVRYVCNALFYDNGGANQPYTNNQNSIQTFTSYNGEKLAINFNTFTMAAGDYISIYDGPSTAYPLIGTYSSSSPGFITSTGSSLTFDCITNSSTNSFGWSASITCAGSVVPVYNMSSSTVTVCNGVFYDGGGGGSNYADNENNSMTFTSANGTFLKFDFNPQHFNLATGDTLFVYDGPSAASPLYAAYTGSVATPGSITSNTSSFTFRFVSNSTSNNVGWQAFISCVAQPDTNPQISMTSGIRATCGGTFYDTGGPNAYYLSNENRIMSFYSNSGCGIRFAFNTFSVFGGAVLYVYDGPSITSPLIATLTGSALPPPVQSSGNVLTFQFVSNANAGSTGWSANISCPNQPSATITANGPLNFCVGESITLTAPPNNTYLWSNGDTTQSITLNNSGSYWVTVTNANNCIAVSNIVTVNSSTSITSNIVSNGPLSFCQGDSVTLTATGGSSYLWSNNSTATALNITQPGSYYVVATNGTCIDTSAAVTVTVNPQPVATLTLPVDSFCVDQTIGIQLSGGSPVGGLWSGPGVNGSLFTPSVAGTGLHNIVYTYTNNYACSDSASQSIFVDACITVAELFLADFDIYPNPAQHFILIRLGENNTAQTIALYDMAGRLILSEAVNNRTQVQLSLIGLESGVYIIEAGNKQVKLVKE